MGRAAHAPGHFAIAMSLLTVTACAPDAASHSTAALVGSEAAPDPASVVAIVDVSRSGLCTGSLIAPRIVLTAKHCVQPPDADVPSPPEDFRVVLGEEVAMPEQTIEVASVATTPGTWGLNGAGGTTGALIGVDVAVIELASDPGITPLPFRRDRVRGIVGTDALAYGYGATPEGGNAERRRASTRVDSMTSQVILTDAVVCSGDSGGPLIHPDGDVIGVASLGPATCGDGPGVFNTLHLFLDLIDGVASPTDDAGLDGATDAAGDSSTGADATTDAEIDTGVGDGAADGSPEAGGDLIATGGGGCAVTPGRPRPSHALISLMLLLGALTRYPAFRSVAR